MKKQKENFIPFDFFAKEVTEAEPEKRNMAIAENLIKWLEVTENKKKLMMEQKTTNWKKELKRLHLREIEKKHPNAFRLSGGYSMKVKPYSDTTANGLTKCICDWIRFNGGDAQRINTTGMPRKMKDGRLINKSIN